LFLLAQLVCLSLFGVYGGLFHHRALFGADRVVPALIRWIFDMCDHLKFHAAHD
jgi:hypothetical protein